MKWKRNSAESACIELSRNAGLLMYQYANAAKSVMVVIFYSDEDAPNIFCIWPVK